jgi:hypothetical protein
VVAPDTATVAVAGTLSFSAVGKLSDGSTQPIGVNWSATGGTIDAAGQYTAGSTPGSFRVVAATTDSMIADTAAVIIATLTEPPAPSVTRVILVPGTASLQTGATQQFAAYGRTSGGDSLTVSVTFAATGGTINSSGNYTAGSTAGTFRVVATQSGGTLADTSQVTITAPAPSPPPSTHAGWYVAPAGSSGASGQVGAPWSLAYALGGAAGQIQPGDTVWLRGGTYRGAFRSSLTGTASQPIIVRQYPGERATLDNAGTGNSGLEANGAYTWFWGFEVMNSQPASGGPIGVNGFGTELKFINLVIHDAADTGLGFWAPAVGGEVYGCLIYHNGKDSNLDHGIYSQNASGVKRFADNAIFDNLAFGIHVYGSDAAQLKGYMIEGNTSFQNGPAGSAAPNILVGGGAVASNITVRNNVFYHSVHSSGNAWIGYEANNQDLNLTGNRIYGGFTALRLWHWASGTVSQNRIWTPNYYPVNSLGSLSGFNWASNTWFRDPTVAAWSRDNVAMTWAGWKTATGKGSSDVSAGNTPTGQEVVVRANQYEPGRGLITVITWTGATSASVDLSGVLRVGQGYEVRRARNLYGSAVSSGTYTGGLVSLPVSAFDVFVVVPLTS